ncbi:MAG: M61 family peptidase [Thermoanaerobaculia bacterium]
MQAFRRFVVSFVIVLTAGAVMAAQTAPIDLTVDMSDIGQKITHTHMVIPVSPGPLDLYYPKWIPGEHGPTGPIVQMAGLHITAAGKELAWKRDLLEMYEIHTVVPAGVDSINVDFDFLAPAGGSFTAGASSTPNLAILSWNSVVLYPAGHASDEILFHPSLILPRGWDYATGMETRSTSGGTIHFEPVSLTTLIDSPVQSGTMLRKIEIPDGAIHHEIDLVSDSRWAEETPKDFAQQYGRLVAEAKALFGAQHYRHYNWLLTLSHHVQHFGLEHHESSDDRVDENLLENESGRNRIAGLLAHEYVHSWNGKYRPPAGLAVSNYDKPMTDELLWVYEGLTTYLGNLLPARAGLWTQEYYRESVAEIASSLSTATGRQWRPLADTAVEAQILYESPRSWGTYRRGVDFYDEGLMVWLDADMTIRRLTNGRKSLDDYLHLFYGGESGHPALKPYTFDDVVNAMNQVVPYDWKNFFLTRLQSKEPLAPMGGITGGGWKLVYNEEPNAAIKAREHDGNRDLTTSIGLYLGKDGRISDVIRSSAAWKAGLAPGMDVVAVNGRKYKPEVIEHVVRDSKSSSAPVTLLIDDDGVFRTYTVDYHGGLRYPHLVREEGKPDLLSKLLQPLAK